MKWWMYQGDVIEGPAVAEYVKVHADRDGHAGEAEARGPAQAGQGRRTTWPERTLLRTYLMLSDVEHLDVDPDDPPPTTVDEINKNDGTEVGAVTSLWAEILKPLSNIVETSTSRPRSGPTFATT